MMAKTKAAKKAKPIPILITCKQVVHYKQTVRMDPEKWQRIKAMDCHDLAKEIVELLDTRDVIMADDPDSDDFELVNVNDPNDSYEG